MDKKMLKNLVGYVAVLMGVLAFVMMFLKAIGIEGDGPKGSEIVFGYKEEGFGVTVEILKFNFIALLAYVLPLAGGVLALLSGLKNNALFNWIGAGLFIVGAVLLFLMPSYWFNAAANDTVKDTFEMLKDQYELLIGTILAAVFSIIGGVACVAKNLLK